jgi:hypothetical protein
VTAKEKHDLLMESGVSWMDVHLEVPHNVEEFPEKVWFLEVAPPFGNGLVTLGAIKNLISFLQGIVDKEDE